MKAVCLISGGLDSCVAAADAVSRFGCAEVAGISFNYGQRHAVELDQAWRVAEALGITTYREVNLRSVWQFSKSNLVGRDGVIPDCSYDEIEGISPVFVPGRNTVFISVASAWAMELGAECIVIGAHADDYNRWAYPDCSDKFVTAMSSALVAGSGGKLYLKAPLVYKTKSQVVKYGLELNAPLHLTWSCYRGEGKPCGTCPTCRDRAKAFELAGVTDPARLEEPMV